MICPQCTQHNLRRSPLPDGTVICRGCGTLTTQQLSEHLLYWESRCKQLNELMDELYAEVQDNVQVHGS